MDEQKQLVFINQYLPGHEQQLIDRFRDTAARRNTQQPEGILSALSEFATTDIVELVVGPDHIGILFQDGRVARLAHSVTTRPLPGSTEAVSTTTSLTTTAAGSTILPSASSSGARSQSTDTIPNCSSGTQVGASSSINLSSFPHHAAVSGATRTAKFRRVMLATSSRRGERAGVIVDRGRPMLPASAVPEDLIAQAQVVLQGKSREVIVRELQRTNLNVNEAVNNLLSRDDDEEEESEGGAAEVCLPEELLSLLEGSGGGLIDADGLYNDSFEYLLSSRDRRSRGDKEKESKSKNKSETASTEANRRFQIGPSANLEWWGACLKGEDDAVRRFSKIVATTSEMIAIGKDDGKLYGWEWARERAARQPHPIMAHLGAVEIMHLAACSLRVAVMTKDLRMATWVDHIACGDRLCKALMVSPQRLPGLNEEIEDIFVSNQIAVARCTNNVFYWCGMYPVTERRRLFEKAKGRMRKHSKSTGTSERKEVVEGAEVTE